MAPSKLDVALMMVPSDLVAALVAFGAEQAFIWNGFGPKDNSEFYYNLGQQLSNLKMKAWDHQIAEDEKWSGF